MFNRPLISVDIGSSAVKVVEVSGHKQKKLRAIGLETLPAEAVDDGIIQNEEAVIEAVKTLFKKLKIMTAGRRAAISLGGSSVLIKKVPVSASKEADLGEQVYYEAEQHFQADMNEIYFDYAILGDPDPETGETPVLLAGAKREMVEQYIGVMRQVGMRTGVVECDVFSAANMFEYSYGAVEGLVGLVNIGANVTQLSVVSNGEYLYTRDIPIGGEEYSRRIMEKMSLDRDNAESLKISASQGDEAAPEELTQVVGEVNEQLVSDIQMTIDYFFQSADLGGQEPVLTNVFLTGGGSRVAGFDAALAAALQIPVQIINPFQNVEVDPKKFEMDYILMQGHLYGVAVGLGLRAFRDNV